MTSQSAPKLQDYSCGNIQDEFFHAIISRCLAECQAHYAERLISIYVHGSVHRCEAVPGVSDLDMCVFVADNFSPEDADWRRQVNERLCEEFRPSSSGWMPHAISVGALLPDEGPSEHDEDLIRNTLLGEMRGIRPDKDSSILLRKRGGVYLLCYDATLMWGRDLLQGIVTPMPGALWAQVAFQCPWDVVRHAAGLEVARTTAFTHENVTEWPLPDDPALKLRKLARLAVLGGACALMITGDFVTYRVADVKPALSRLYPEWRTFLEHTSDISILPSATAALDVDDYLRQLVLWMDWVGGLFSAVSM